MKLSTPKIPWCTLTGFTVAFVTALVFLSQGYCVPGGLFMFLAGTYAEAFSWRCHWRDN